MTRWIKLLELEWPLVPDPEDKPPDKVHKEVIEEVWRLMEAKPLQQARIMVIFALRLSANIMGRGQSHLDGSKEGASKVGSRRAFGC